MTAAIVAVACGCPKSFDWPDAVALTAFMAALAWVATAAINRRKR